MFELTVISSGQTKRALPGIPDRAFGGVEEGLIEERGCEALKPPGGGLLGSA